MKIFYLLTLISLIFVSCKKPASNDLSSQSHTYENSNLTHFQSFHLYTQSGEIHNQVLLENYVNEYQGYFFKPGDHFIEAAFQKFIMVNDDSLINISMPVIQYTKRTNIDTYDKFNSIYTDIVNDTNTFQLHIMKYKTYHEFKMPNGNSYYENENPAFIVKKINDSLFFPIVKFITVSRQSYALNFFSGKFNNIFDPSGVNKLGLTDTLLFQSFDLAMKKIQ